MTRACLDELNMTTRQEIVRFLKQLWSDEGADCPICGRELELLHKKAKKSNCDWQCKICGKIYKTIPLLNELNERMP